jgi:hypothetical protein
MTGPSWRRSPLQSVVKITDNPHASPLEFSLPAFGSRGAAAMDSGELKLANVVFLAGALMIAAHGMSWKVRLPHLEWSTVSKVLACPYMQPPDCVAPLPGL